MEYPPAEPPEDSYFPESIYDGPPPEDSYPPPEDYGPPSDNGYGSGRKSSFNKNKNKDLSPLQQNVIDTLRKVLSSTHEKSTDLARQLLERIMSSDKILKELTDETKEIYDGVFEVLIHECSVTDNGVLDLTHLPILTEYTDEVSAEIATILRKKVTFKEEPHSEWQALAERVQRHYALVAAQDFARSIETKQTVKTMMEKFKKLEPPTAQKALVANKEVLTARTFMKQHKAASATKVSLRFSSGMYTFDKAFTGKGDSPGFIEPGQLMVVMGPTGTGKSSFSYGITPAATQDMRNWGLPDAKHVLLHTEEETVDKIDACRMGPGQTYGHLADQLVVENIGTSRQRMVTILYQLIMEADERARETKRPITDFLPYILQLDYIQAIIEPGETEVQATTTTAELILRGIVGWNPEEMAKFSGISFREYSGMAWPEGMEHHRVAVIAYAQLVKVDEGSEKYSSRKKDDPLKFAVPNGDGDPSWEVKDGDLRLFTKGQMRGSGVIANNAHAIIILHRSLPNPNQVDQSKTEPDGTEHLADTRARILLEKARGGTSLPFIPLSFDRQVDGPKAQYFDDGADAAIADQILKNYDKEFYKGRGSMIIPKRPARSPLTSYSY